MLTRLLPRFLFCYADFEIRQQNASAIVIIPPITTNWEFVLDFNPTINPMVVLIPEISPKLKPAGTAQFIINCAF